MDRDVHKACVGGRSGGGGGVHTGVDSVFAPDEVHDAVQEHGYVIMDIGASDIFDDETDEQVYLVDFSQVKPYDEVY